jgi:hypothetical protein
LLYRFIISFSFLLILFSYIFFFLSVFSPLKMF